MIVFKCKNCEKHNSKRHEEGRHLIQETFISLNEALVHLQENPGHIVYIENEDD